MCIHSPHFRQNLQFLKRCIYIFSFSIYSEKKAESLVALPPIIKKWHASDVGPSCIIGKAVVLSKSTLKFEQCLHSYNIYALMKIADFFI